MSPRQMYAWHKHYTPNMGVSPEIILTKYVYTLYYPIYNEYIWCICQYHIYHIVLFHIKHGIICLSVSIPQLWRQVWYFVFSILFPHFQNILRKGIIEQNWSTEGMSWIVHVQFATSFAKIILQNRIFFSCNISLNSEYMGIQTYKLTNIMKGKPKLQF